MKKDEPLGYIINCYKGTEPSHKNPHRKRRVFEWQEDGKVVKGNTEAFVIHLGQKFGHDTDEADAHAVHSILIDLGEVLVPIPKHTRSKTGPLAGRFAPNDPDKWIVSRVAQA